jgi:hypothetical protein
VNDAAVKGLSEAEIACQFSGFRAGSIFGWVHCMTGPPQTACGESDSSQESSS